MTRAVINMHLSNLSRNPAVARPARRQANSTRAAAVSDVTGKSYIINIIPNNGQWETGVPPVMGAHLMASGAVAPVSQSKGAGLGVYPPDVAYYSNEGEDEIQVGFTEEAATQALIATIAEASEKALRAKGTFSLVLSGGSLPKYLSGLANVGLQWDKTHVFFVDERNVPHSSADSTLKAVKEQLLNKVPIPAANVHAIMENLSVEKAAVQYEGKLISLRGSVLTCNEAGFPVFDMVVLGVGIDGHVASLFAHKNELKVTSSWVLPVKNSPKPPSERITMTLPVINAAKNVAFFAVGAGKADIVMRTLEVQALPGALPAQLVRPSNGAVTWILDVESAKQLSPSTWGNAKQYPRSTFPKEAKDAKE